MGASLAFTNSFEKGILKTRETKGIRGIVLRKKNIFALRGSRKFNNDYVNGSDIRPHFRAANGLNFLYLSFRLSLMI